MIAVAGIIFAETRSGSRYRSVIVVSYLNNPLMVEAARCIVGVRTISAIVTGGRTLSLIKRIIICCPVISESGLHRM